MNTLEVLKAAQELIREPEAWARYLYAKDGSGHDAKPWSDEAVCWCAVGALQKINGSYQPSDPWFVLTKSSEELYGRGASEVNDEGGHEAVMAVYDHAIAKLEAE